MADSRDELIQMLAELRNLPEEEVTKLLAGMSDETEGDGVDRELAALFVKMLEEEKEKKKRGAEKVCADFLLYRLAIPHKYLLPPKRKNFTHNDVNTLYIHIIIQ